MIMLRRTGEWQAKATLTQPQSNSIAWQKICSATSVGFDKYALHWSVASFWLVGGRLVNAGKLCHALRVLNHFTRE